MTRKLTIVSLLLLTWLLTLAPLALASATWYVDGVHGSHRDGCLSRLTHARPSDMRSRLPLRGIPSWSPRRSYFRSSCSARSQSASGEPTGQPRSSHKR